MYHVTKSDLAEDIWNQGIKSREPNKSWMKKRKEMRCILDDIGNDKYRNWINRQNAVFMWTSHRRAMRYAERYVDPAIVEVETSDMDLWSIRNTDIEILFDDFDNMSEDKFRKNATKVVDGARKWNGEINEDIEIWTSSPVHNSSINQIYNINGECLEF